MDTQSGIPDFKNRSRLLKIFGAVLLVAGIAIGLLAPLEMYCFYLFSEGGRFYYEGFGFGSFMFGNIASQIIGYYLLAIPLIILGYGHLKARRWIKPLSLTLLWSWLVVGAPLIVVVFFILLASKDLAVNAILLALVALVLSYFVIPGLLIRFYLDKNVTLTLEARDAKNTWLEGFPLHILVISTLLVFYVIMFHILILFNGIFPVFGTFYFGLQGIILLDLCIAILILIIWGILQRRLWAWWSALIFLGVFTFSTIFTFARYSYTAILSGLAFPAREMEFLDGIPVQGFHFSILVGVPLIITWIIIILSKRHFTRTV